MHWIQLNLSTLLLVAIVLICPVSMMWMMRGRNKGGNEDNHAVTRDDGVRDGRVVESRGGSAGMPSVGTSPVSMPQERASILEAERRRHEDGNT